MLADPTTRRRRASPRPHSVVRALALAVATVVLSLAAYAGSAFLVWSRDLPTIEGARLDVLAQTNRVYASDGSLVAEHFPLDPVLAQVDRRVVGLEHIAPAILVAVVAYEDQQFFRHRGVHPPSLLRALASELLGRRDRGGSTITMQVVKNYLLTDVATERTLERKVKEILLAIALERRRSKPEILELYLNRIYWGANVFGVERAAWAYVGKAPDALGLAEALYLASLISAPNAFQADYPFLRRSMRIVLRNLVGRGVISAEEAAAAWLTPLEPVGWEVEYDERGELLGARQHTTVLERQRLDHVGLALPSVLGDVAAAVGRERLWRLGGLDIVTSLDPRAQRAAEEGAARIPDGAVIVLDAASGGIVATAGETTTRWPLRSLFFPIVYAAAVETEGALASMDPRAGSGPEGMPRNVLVDRGGGTGTWQEALRHGQRDAALHRVARLPAGSVNERAIDLGYANAKRRYLSTAIGEFDATPPEHAAAMASLVNGGYVVRPHVVTEVRDATGATLFSASGTGPRMWRGATADAVMDALHRSVSGPGAVEARAAVPHLWLAVAPASAHWYVGMSRGAVVVVAGSPEEPGAAGAPRAATQAFETSSADRASLRDVWRRSATALPEALR